jgi:hypothetical protein
MLAPSPTRDPLPSSANFHQGFSVGRVSLELRGHSAADVHGGVEMMAFRSYAGGADWDVGVDIKADVRWTDELHTQGTEITFESGAIWRLFRAGNDFLFEFTSPLLGDCPYKKMRVGRDFSQAEVILSRAARERCGNISPLEYPACELLITNYLAHHGLGVEVHGCGLIDAETGGHLFLGHSGAGKSTTARLWEKLWAPEILSDDRIILRLHNGELWMYGTPWHGEAAFAAPGSAKLNRIHILKHGPENRFSFLSQASAAGEIFARSFPPFHSPAGLEHTVEFIKRALDVVPCYQFQFVPDDSSTQAVRAFHD